MNCYGDILKFVKISVKPDYIVIVQVNMPTTDHDDAREKMNNEISDKLHQEATDQVSLIVIG